MKPKKPNFENTQDPEFAKMHWEYLQLKLKEVKKYTRGLSKALKSSEGKKDEAK